MRLIKCIVITWEIFTTHINLKQKCKYFDFTWKALASEELWWSNHQVDKQQDQIIIMCYHCKQTNRKSCLKCSFTLLLTVLL